MVTSNNLTFLKIHILLLNECVYMYIGIFWFIGHLVHFLVPIKTDSRNCCSRRTVDAQSQLKPGVLTTVQSYDEVEKSEF